MTQMKHQPSHWVAGILKDEEWYGNFHATPDELLKWCEEENDDPAVWSLVMDLCECQEVYQKWWEGLEK